MKNVLSLIKSSFHDIGCCDEAAPVVNDDLTAWRAQSSSITCVLDGSGNKTGYAHVGNLEEYKVSTGLLTGTIKQNLSSDSNYIADYISPSCEKDTPASPPSDGVVSVGMHAPGKGQFYLINAGGGTINRSISNGLSSSIPVSAGVYAVHVVTYAPTPATPVAVDIVIGSEVYQSSGGDITISELSSPFNVGIYPYGEGADHILFES